MLNTKVLVGAFGAFLAMACGSADAPVTEEGAPNEETAPEEVDVGGRRFIRANLLTDAEREEMLIAAKVSPGEVVTPEKLAAQLRGQSLIKGIPYVEMEPNLEMAKRILSGEAIPDTSEGAPREVRRVIGPDGRAHTPTAFNVDPSPWVGFSEIGCTVNMIGYRTAVTAAHCVYETRDPAFTQGWLCRNNTVSNTGCPGVGYPRFRFGVEDLNGFSGWVANPCIVATIPTAYISSVNNSTGAYAKTRWDYAVLNLNGCATAGMGHYGTTGIADSGFPRGGRIWGYPGRATCPDNALGTAADCPGAFRYQGGSAPFTGAEIWGMNLAGAVALGASNSADVIQSTIDTTGGQSGSAVYDVFGGQRQLFGIHHGYTGSINLHHRWNTETYNFVDANSDFPSDI